VFVTTANDNFSPYIALTSQFPITRVLDSVYLFSHPTHLRLTIFFQTNLSNLHLPFYYLSHITPLFHFFSFLSSQVPSLSSLLFLYMFFLLIFFTYASCKMGYSYSYKFNINASLLLHYIASSIHIHIIYIQLLRSLYGICNVRSNKLSVLPGYNNFCLSFSLLSKL